MPENEEPSDTLKAIHGYVELLDIGFRELSSIAEPVEEADETPHFALQVDLEELDDLEDEQYRRVRYGLELNLETTEGRTRIVASATYRLPRERSEAFTMSVAVEYANHVALMALIPYVREALSDLSVKVLNNRITMPTFQRGELSFPLPNENTFDPS